MSKSFKTLENGKIEFRVDFKVISEARAAKLGKPELAGQKRPSFKVVIQAPNTGDKDNDLIITEALVAYGKALVAEHDNDWSYVPDASDITVVKLAEYIRKPSLRGQRTLTINNIQTWAGWISPLITEVIGKSQGFAATVSKLAEAKFIGLAGMPAKIDVVTQVISDDRITDKLMELPENGQSQVIIEVHAALLEKLQEMKDSEGLDLEALDS